MDETDQPVRSKGNWLFGYHVAATVVILLAAVMLRSQQAGRWMILQLSCI